MFSDKWLKIAKMTSAPMRVNDRLGSVSPNDIELLTLLKKCGCTQKKSAEVLKWYTGKRISEVTVAKYTKSVKKVFKLTVLPKSNNLANFRYGLKQKINAYEQSKTQGMGGSR